jgi:hypothetical protein
MKLNSSCWICSITLIATLFLEPAVAQQQSFPVLIGVNPGGFGVGYDGLTGTIKLQCVNSDPKDKDKTKVDLPTVTFDLKRVKSRSDYRSRMRFDAAASLGIGMFSGHLAVSTYSDTRESIFSNLLFLHSGFTTNQSMLTNPTLNLEAIEKLKLGSKDFYNRCGTGFIIGYTYGGDFTGAYELTTKENAQQNDITASIEAAIGPFNSGRASLKSTVENLSQQEALNYNSLQYGAILGVPPADPDALERYARAFGTKAKDKPFPLIAWVQDYTGLSYNKCGSHSAKCRINLASFSKQLNTLSLLVAQRERGLDLRDALLEARDYPSNFVGITRQEVVVALDEVEKVLAIVKDATEQCRNNPFNKCIMPRLRYPNVQLRRARWINVVVDKDAGGKIGEVGPGESKIAMVRGAWKLDPDPRTCVRGGQGVILSVDNTVTGHVNDYKMPFPLLQGPPAGGGTLIIGAKVVDCPACYYNNDYCDKTDPLQIALVDPSPQEHLVLASHAAITVALDALKETAHYDVEQSRNVCTIVGGNRAPALVTVWEAKDDGTVGSQKYDAILVKEQRYEVITDSGAITYRFKFRASDQWSTKVTTDCQNSERVELP